MINRINFCYFEFLDRFFLDSFIKCKIYDFIIKLSLKNLEFLGLVI